METTKNNVLFETYNDMMQSMSRSTKNPVEAELLFWYITYGMIAQSKIAAKNDALGIIIHKFTGSNHGCNTVADAVEFLAPDYVLFIKKYGLSDKLSELGEHWKEIFWKGRFGQILILRGWVRTFLNECMPVINETIAACENEWKDYPHNMLTAEDFKARKRAYSAYKRKLKTLLSKLDTAKEFYDLRREDLDYYKFED